MKTNRYLGIVRRVVIDKSSNPVRAVREATGLSVEELAAATGYPVWWVEEIEKRRLDDISLHLLLSFASQAGFTVVLEGDR